MLAAHLSSAQEQSQAQALRAPTPQVEAAYYRLMGSVGGCRRRLASSTTGWAHVGVMLCPI